MDFRPTTQSFQSLSNHTHKLAYCQCSQYVVSYIPEYTTFTVLHVIRYTAVMLSNSEDFHDRNKP